MTRAGAAPPGRAPGWRRTDYFDLGVIGAIHGMSDGFNHVMVPVLALIVADLGLSPFEAGLLLSLFSLGTLLFQYPLSMFADHTGRKKTILIAGMGLAALALAAMGWSGAFVPLMVLAFVAGAGNSVYHPCGTALTAERFAANRAFAISLNSLGGNVGTGIMPVAQAAVAAVAGWRWALGLCAAPALVLLPLLGLRFPERSRQRTGGRGGGLRLGFGALLAKVLRNRNIVLLAATYTCRTLCQKGMIGFLPLLAAAKLGMSTAAIGLAVSVHFTAGIVAKPLMGLLYNRWGARAALFVPLVLLGVFTLAMPYMPSRAGLVVLAALTGLVSFVSPIILTAAADFADEDALASSVGFIYTVDGLGFLSPLIGGWLAERLSLDASYAYYALAAWAGVAVSSRLGDGRGGGVSAH